MRWVLLHLERGRPRHVIADMTPLYAVAAEALGIGLDVFNMEGACILGRTMRWFHRGLPSAGLPSGSVDLDLTDVLAAVHGRIGPGELTVSAVRHYDLGSVAGVGLAITDAIALPTGDVLCSAAAEASPNSRDDGPVVASALVRLSEDVLDVTPLPLIEGAVAKIEGLMLLDAADERVRLLAVADGDDPQAPPLCVRLRLDL